MTAPARAETAHLVIDMQRLFDEETVWHTPALRPLLPNVTALCRACAGRNVFARFTVPETADHAQGQWQVYYRRWSMLVGEVLDPGLIDLVEDLAPHAAQERLVDKPTYSPFKVPGFAEGLWRDGIRHVLFSGVETDVCVLAGIFDAVDMGFGVTVATDAVASSDMASHQAVLDHVLPRMPDQIRLLSTAEILAEMRAQGGV